jgi:hypothetical protein
LLASVDDALPPGGRFFFAGAVSRRVPEWVVFVDLSGSRVRVRSAEIRMIVESRSEQRAFDRALERRLDGESTEEMND